MAFPSCCGVSVPPRPHAEDDDWPVDRGRPLGLRVLALVGALSFLMLGLSVVAPLLQPRPKAPTPTPVGVGGTA